MAEGVISGSELARRHGVDGRVSYLQGDLTQAPLQNGKFDAVVMECVLSTLTDQEAALRRCHTMLRPGGRLGLTDMTVNGPLPSELSGLFASAGCVGGARSLDQYQQMVAAAGLVVDHCQDLPDVVSALLRQISGKLLMADAAVGLGKLPLDRGVLLEARRLLSRAQEVADSGLIGYGLVVAHRMKAQDG